MIAYITESDSEKEDLKNVFEEIAMVVSLDKY